jgi:hypothetical protein
MVFPREHWKLNRIEQQGLKLFKSILEIREVQETEQQQEGQETDQQSKEQREEENQAARVYPKPRHSSKASQQDEKKTTPRKERT